MTCQTAVGVDISQKLLDVFPLYLVIVVGLAIFLLIAVFRSLWVPVKAVLEGFQHSARVVTAAAVIMMGVFAGFALTDDVIIKTIGFALTVGVLADAFLVRMLIVPALMLIVGERIWWMPRWFERITPDLDIEGESLLRRLEAERPRAARQPSPTRVR